jgi:putative aminopeptidase FrvX
MNLNRIDLFKELTDAFGPSGYETDVAKIMKKYFSGCGNVTTDKLGSVICSQEANGPKIMFAAHMDEIGFIVQSITKEGYLRILPVGGWAEMMLMGQRVIVRSNGQDIHGVIGSKPVHELKEEERKKIPEFRDLYVDVGVSMGFDVKTSLKIRPGDPIVPYSPFAKLGNSLYLAKAWDDRIGCAVILELAQRLNNHVHPNSIHFVGTTQEEVGLRGAQTAATLVNPDIAFAVDVSLCREYPGFIEKEVTERLKGGVAILFHDMSMIPNTKLRDFVINVAEEKKIPYHLTSVRGGYDTGRIHLHNIGVPSLAIGIPARYIHSHAGIIAEDDFNSAVNLLTEVTLKLNQEKLHEILSL